jgi:predicted DCC family thiol-disulfide oxidoreductase YuxK
MGMANHDGQTPVLIYGGDCGFCRYWVRYWERLTGSRVRYEPYQSVADHYPAISLEEFAHSIQFIDGDGQRYSGAHAAFRVLDRVPQQHFWLWLYRHLPGFAPLAELSYDVIARHRVAAAKGARWLWGDERCPDDYALVGWVFLRLIALIYLAAFASLAVQITGLIGAEGILPAGELSAQSGRSHGLSHLSGRPPAGARRRR